MTVVTRWFSANFLENIVAVVFTLQREKVQCAWDLDYLSCKLNSEHVTRLVNQAFIVDFIVEF